MANNERVRKKDSARLVWDTKPRRAPNPKDIEFQTAEVVIPNYVRDSGQIPMSFRDGLFGEQELDKQQMNRLVWGDNLLAMQALLAHGYEGKINLVYIDPPFASSEDYYFSMTIEGAEFVKEPSAIERVAYKDTWAGGIDSYLDMLYPRLQLIKRLLTDTGSVYVHMDSHVGHYVKALLDEIFGTSSFINQVIWQKIRVSKGQARGYGNVHDMILVYARSPSYTFTKPYTRLADSYIESHYSNYEPETGRRYQLADLTQSGSGPPRRFGETTLEPPPGKHWIWSQDRIDTAMKNGLIVFTSGGTPRVKRYLDESRGNPIEDIWVDIPPLNSMARERLNFDTQKPEALLERIIKASSNDGDLVADFFCGSGTTLAVAEQLGRRWIGCDLSKVAVQVSRTRLVQQDAKPFLIENIGNYQREMIYLSGGRIGEMQQVILKLYGATPRKGSQLT